MSWLCSACGEAKPLIVLAGYSLCLDCKEKDDNNVGDGNEE